MNFIVLFITNKLMRYSATYYRLFIAATLGASWAIIIVTIPVHVVILENICTYFLISVLMIRICVKKNIVKGVCVLYAVTFCLSGILHMLYYDTNAGYYVNTVILGNRMMVIFIFLSVILVAFMYKYLMSVTVYQTKICKVIMKIENVTIETMGFVDTGNILRDQIYNKPVCIVEKSLLENVLDKLDDYTKVKYHMIPFNSLGCESGVIEVIMVNVIYIYDSNCKNKGVVVKKNAVIGLSKQKLSSDNAYQMLINCEMLRQ